MTNEEKKASLNEFLKKRKERIKNMTLAEARDIISSTYGHSDMRMESDKALQMLLDCADKALEQQPCEDCISRQAVLDVINFEDEWLFDAKSYNADTKIAFSAIKSKISELPSVTPQASEEDIHREREQAYMLGYEDASKKFRTEPCEDAVNREAVLELAKKGILVSNDNYKCVVNAIKSLPPVTLQRPKGKWITQAYSMRITCTNCEKEIWYSGRNDYKYCPNCGAYMGGAET